MEIGTWAKELPYAVTVCDKQGVIVSMNDKACLNYAKYGGAELIGKNLLDCHGPKSRKIVEDMLVNQTSSHYTTEKNGIKKFIAQTPWYDQGEYGGIVEVSMEIPFDTPHYIRK